MRDVPARPPAAPGRASRSRPGPTRRCRCPGCGPAASCVELRAADLRFTPDEAGAFLTDVMGLDLGDAQVAALDDADRGLGRRAPARRALAARGATTPPASSTASPAATGSSSTTSSTRCCATSPSRCAASCSTPSVLRQLTGPLCDAPDRRQRRQRDARGARPGQPVRRPARRPAAAGTATTTCSPTRSGRASSAERPDRVPRLHRAASEWYAAHGPARGRRACTRWSRGDPEHAADLVEAALPDLRRERRDATAARVADRAAGRGGARPSAAGHLPRLDPPGRGRPRRAWRPCLARRRARPCEARPPPAPPAPRPRTSEELRTLPATMAIFRASAAQARGDTDATRSTPATRLALDRPGRPHGPRRAHSASSGSPPGRRGDLDGGGRRPSPRRCAAWRAAGDVADELGSTVALAEHVGGPGATRRGPTALRASPGDRRSSIPVPHWPPSATCTSVWPTCSSSRVSSTPRRAPETRPGARRVRVPAGEPLPLVRRDGSPARAPRVTSRRRPSCCAGREPLLPARLLPRGAPHPGPAGAPTDRAGSTGRRVGLGRRPAGAAGRRRVLPR